MVLASGPADAAVGVEAALDRRVVTLILRLHNGVYLLSSSDRPCRSFKVT